MQSIRFFPSYLLWHYGRALTDFLEVWRNLFWFVGRFFSVGVLTRTLFAPWRRLSETYSGHGFDLEAIGGALIINVLMRIVGLVVRAITLLIALVVFLLLIFVGVIGFFVWLFLPIVIPGLALIGLGLLFV